MHSLVLIAFYAGVGLYIAATALFFAEIVRKDRARGRAEWAPRVLGAGAIFHLAHVGATSLVERSCPLFSVESALSFSSLAAVTVYLLWRGREPIGPLGAYTAPPALASMIDAQVSAKGPLLGEYSPGVLALHVASSTVGLALFLLAGGASVYYLIAERRLKSKRPGNATGKLPPLEVLDRVAYRFLLAGLPLFTLGLVSAMFFGGGGSAATGPEVARTLLAYGSWTIVALVLLMRSVAGWRGRKAAYGTLVGVIFMLLVIAVYVSGAGAPRSARYDGHPESPMDRSAYPPHRSLAELGDPCRVRVPRGRNVSIPLRALRARDRAECWPVQRRSARPALDAAPREPQGASEVRS